MELRYSTVRIDHTRREERYFPASGEVHVTEIIFDEEEQRQRYAELFVSGRGLINDYLQIHSPALVTLDSVVSEEDIGEDIRCGESRERHRNFTVVVSPYINNVPAAIVIPSSRHIYYPSYS